MIPCTISSVEHRNDYCPTLAEGERRADIIQRLNAYSTGLGAVIEADGKVRGPEDMEKTTGEGEGEEAAGEGENEETSGVILCGETS